MTQELSQCPVFYVRALVALLLNLFILPGLGSLIGGKVLTGIVQIAIMVACWLLIMSGYKAEMVAAFGGGGSGGTQIALATILAVGDWIYGIIVGIVGIGLFSSTSVTER